MDEKRKRVLFWAILLLFPLSSLLFLSAEVYLRLVFRPYTDAPEELAHIRPDAELGWWHQPSPGLFNSEGFRNAVEFAKGPVSHRRIMFIGDSILHAYFRRSKPAGLTDILADMASARQERLDLMNLSSPGFSTYQERLLLERHFPVYQPDTVVIAYCLNDSYPTENHFLNLDHLYDHWQLDQPTRQIIDNPQPKAINPLLTVRWLKQHWPWMLRVFHRSLEADIARQFYDGNTTAQRQHQIVVDDLRHMIEETTAAGARCLIVIYPRAREVVQNKRLKDAAFLIEALGDTAEIYDLYPLFREQYEAGYLAYLTDDDAHPDSIGQQLVAEFLYPILTQP